jgi:S-formylglutathione hydrolase
MGGHGALTLYLSSQTKQYRSASAFAPISNPTKCPWGEKAFKGYLQGGIAEAEEKYDATELIKRVTEPVHILIDYVSRNVALAPSTHAEILTRVSYREREIISTSKVNCYQRTSSKRHGMQVTMKCK